MFALFDEDFDVAECVFAFKEEVLELIVYVNQLGMGRWKGVDQKVLRVDLFEKMFLVLYELPCVGRNVGLSGSFGHGRCCCFGFGN